MITFRWTWMGRWVAVLLVAAGGVAAPLQAAELVVAQIAPLSGVLASTGKQMVLGGKIYFDSVNASGGIHGAKIRHLVLDDGYKVDETVRLAGEVLAKPEVVALFGFAGTANVGKLLSDGVLEAGGAPLVAPYTGGDILRNPFNPWIFHVRAGYGNETEHIVKQVTTLGRSVSPCCTRTMPLARPVWPAWRLPWLRVSSNWRCQLPMNGTPTKWRRLCV